MHHAGSASQDGAKASQIGESTLAHVETYHMHVLHPHRQVEQRSCVHSHPMYKRCLLYGYDQVHMNILQLLADIQFPQFIILQQLSDYSKHRLRMGPTQPLTPRNLTRTRQPRYDLLQRRAVTLARKQDFVAASRCFEALLQHQPGSEKAWISYAQVCLTLIFHFIGSEASRRFHGKQYRDCDSLY
jgi:hypothetical protein